MKKLILLVIGLSLLIAATSSVLAEGTIRLDPALPVMTGTSETFDVWVEGSSSDPTTDPHVLLVMTDACYDGLGANGVKVGGALITAWEEETEHTEGIKVPHDGIAITTGAAYTVASLMDHLGTTDPIWWAFEPLGIGDITDSPAQFTVDLDSSAPRMLVYVLGKTEGSQEFDNRVPPTQPGFMIPEPATIAAVATSFVALAVYAIRRKKC